MPEISIFDLPVHPDADLFPMLDKEEMEELAADIKENGLIEPIVIAQVNGEAISTKTGEVLESGQWMLIDGRNRREACRRAKVEPAYRILSDDPRAFIVSANINRRHMTKGQRAMAVAMIYPEPGERGRGKKSFLKNDFAGSVLRYARTVLKTLPDLAPQVLLGAVTLNDAYKQAQDRIKATQSDEAKFSRLKEAAPDLATLVTEERLTLVGAMAELEEREQKAAMHLAGDLEAFYRLSRLIGNHCASAEGAKFIRELATTHAKEFEKKFKSDADEYLNVIIDAFKNANEILKALKG